MITAPHVLSFLRLRMNSPDTSPTQMGLIATFLRDIESHQLYTVGTYTTMALEVLDDPERLCVGLYLCAQEVETPWAPIDTLVNFSIQPGGDLGDNLLYLVDAFHRATVFDERLDPDCVLTTFPARSALLLSYCQDVIEPVYFVHQGLRPIQSSIILTKSLDGHGGSHDFGDYSWPELMN